MSGGELMLEYDEPDKLLGMKRMDGGMQHVTKSRTMSAVHAEIGDWKGNPSRRLEVMLITRHARHAPREGPGTRNAELGPHLRQELQQEGQRVDTIEHKCGHESRWGFEVCRWRLKSDGERAEKARKGRWQQRRNSPSWVCTKQVMMPQTRGGQWS